MNDTETSKYSDDERDEAFNTINFIENQNDEYFTDEKLKKAEEKATPQRQERSKEEKVPIEELQKAFGKYTRYNKNYFKESPRYHMMELDEYITNIHSCLRGRKYNNPSEYWEECEEMLHKPEVMFCDMED